MRVLTTFSLLSRIAIFPLHVHIFYFSFRTKGRFTLEDIRCKIILSSMLCQKTLEILIL